MQKFVRLEAGGARLVPCNLDNAAINPNDIPRVNEVVDSGDGNPKKSDDEPPAAVLSSLSTARNQAFLRLWNIILIHFWATHFDF